MKYIEIEDVQKCLDTLLDVGYTFYQVEEGGVGYGHIILVAPNENYYNIEIFEKYLNCWSSTHFYRKSKKLSKRQLKLIEKSEAQDEFE